MHQKVLYTGKGYLECSSHQEKGVILRRFFGKSKMVLYGMYTLKNKGSKKWVFKAMPFEEPFLVPQRTFLEEHLKNMKNFFFHYKEPFVQ